MNALQPGIVQDVFLQAIYALRENKLRTVLSILGIAVGVAAVTVVGTVTQGVKQHVFTELESFGLETLWIYRRRDDGEPIRARRKGSGIDNEDLKALQSCCPSVRRVSPVVYSKSYTERVRSSHSYALVNLEGVGLNYLAINNDRLLAGREFREDDMKRRNGVAIIGMKVKEKLFGPRQDPLGRIIRWGETRLTVIGLLADKKRDLLTRIGANTYDAGKRVLIPYPLYQQRLGKKEIHTLQAEALRADKTQKAIMEIVQVLDRRHAGRFEYRADSMDAWIQTADRMLQNISLAGLLAASISLLVGGIGIMNIMTTSVVERTREIGIRKALGAQRRDLLFQFLMEATVVSLIGGGFGLLLGAVAVFGISLMSGYSLGMSWGVAAIALLVSVIVGMVSGYYPAYRAATMKPVDALRFE